jgi:hypothetical protein
MALASPLSAAAELRQSARVVREGRLVRFGVVLAALGSADARALLAEHAAKGIIALGEPPGSATFTELPPWLRPQ